MTSNDHSNNTNEGERTTCDVPQQPFDDVRSAYAIVVCFESLTTTKVRHGNSKQRQFAFTKVVVPTTLLADFEAAVATRQRVQQHVKLAADEQTLARWHGGGAEEERSKRTRRK